MVLQHICVVQQKCGNTTLLWCAEKENGNSALCHTGPGGAGMKMLNVELRRMKERITARPVGARSD